MTLEINGLPPTSGTGPTNKTTSLPPSPIDTPIADSVQLSQMAVALQSITKELSLEPTIDMNKINAYREAIANGSYVINAESIAQRLIQLDSLFKE